MKSDWSFRWWDAAAVAVAVAAAVWLVQYSLSRQTATEPFEGSAVIQVRVDQPLAEVAEQVKRGEVLRNRRGERVGMILRVDKLAPKSGGVLSNMLQEKFDLLVTVNVEGGLRLTRQLEGFPQEPGSLKAGNWCLLSLDRAELSGVIVSVKRFGGQPQPSPTPQ